ncbi:MAG: 23S rRNA (uracil(1939)-C(5))-methyltransferase RlmD [Oscillatoriales cyanobacterium RM2_1_1]|nr:23S rRNA (uracil(1939)-C(5))-methyltransferase RlmD [Oscillatoriales cyanobacterium SM2_3_0]NJO46758.1 23S rRNA (uracil(1939)-C(5))-methyltransferase RlmD [Oscillatoriales cyanobacterium RM2_1_1]
MGRRTGEILLTLVVKGQEVTKTPEKVPLGVENTERSPHLLLKKRRKTVPASATKIIDSGSHRHSKTVVTDAADLSGLEAQAQRWLEQYPQLVGVCLNFNAHPGNVVFGQETFCVAGRGYLQEEFAGLTLRLNPETFFQVNTEAAEALLREIQGELNLQGHEILVDAYCGIGTLSLPLAQQVQQVIGLEVQASAIAQAQQNSEFNQIKNISFQAGTVETLLPNLDVKPDIVVLDPPRKGCDPRVIEALIELQSQKLVYMSCKPATLARDLKLLCESGIYRLTRIQPADFFPQTSHVECAAFLVKN